MKKILKVLALIYILMLPFYDIPKTLIEGIAVSGFVMITLLIFKFIASIGKKEIILNLKLVAIFFPLIIAFLASSLINSELFFSKSINHIIFYIYSFAIYTYGTYEIVREYGNEYFSKILSLSVIVIIAIGFFEMAIYYKYGFNAYANFLNHGQNVGVHSGIPRMRSTFNEPSHLSMFLLSVFPIIIYSKNKLAIVLSVIAFFLTLSVSAFVGLGFALFVTSILYVKKLKVKHLKILFLFIVILVPILHFIYPTLGGLINKVVNLQSSDSIRYNAWLSGIELISKAPIFGYGPASYYYFMEYGVFNWYLQLFIESGIIGILSLLIFWTFIIFNASKKKNIFYIISILAFLGQMVSMNHYYIPGIWVLIGFIYGDSGENNYNIKKEEV